MANQSKLKAWVRYDGTGRVISGGPIFQVNKPKVGNWREINANLCCNGTTPTTTTTTTAGGGGVTPTAWVAYGAFNPYSACQGVGGSSRIIYTSTSNIILGTVFYNDAALTELYNSSLYGSAVAINGMNYFLGDNGGSIVIDISSCNPFTTTSTTTTQAPVLSFIGRGGSTSGEACGAGNNETFYTTGPFQAQIYPQTGNIIYFDQAMTQLVTYPYISLPGVGAVFQCTNGQLFNMSPCQ